MSRVLYLILSHQGPINDFYLEILISNLHRLKNKDDKLIILNFNEDSNKTLFKDVSQLIESKSENFVDYMHKLARGKKYSKIVLIPSNVLFTSLIQFNVESLDSTFYHFADYIDSSFPIYNTDQDYFEFLLSIPQLIVLTPENILETTDKYSDISFFTLISLIKIKNGNQSKLFDQELTLICNPSIFDNIGMLKTELLPIQYSQISLDLLKKITSYSHNNEIFWNYRYTVNKILGSGIGSRGENLNWKRNLVNFLDVKTKSVLDVGCGDFEVLKAIEFANYTGIDISDSAIKIAKKNRPDLKFLLFKNEFPELVKSKIVLCFDVLIHQDSIEKYQKLMNFIVASSEELIIVSGYVKNLNAKNPMIFFYESVIDSLSNFEEVKNIYLIGNETPIALLIADKGNIDPEFYDNLKRNIDLTLRKIK